MQITIRTKKRNLSIRTGDDAVEVEQATWVQLSSADLSVVPEEEIYYYEEEEDHARTGSFGFSPRTAAAKTVHQA